MIITRAPIKISGGGIAIAQKLSIYAELDQIGETFIKTECIDGPYTSMISCNYKVEEAIEEFTTLMKDFLLEQIENLKKEAERLEN